MKRDPRQVSCMCQLDLCATQPWIQAPRYRNLFWFFGFCFSHLSMRADPQLATRVMFPFASRYFGTQKEGHRLLDKVDDQIFAEGQWWKAMTVMFEPLSLRYLLSMQLISKHSFNGRWSPQHGLTRSIFYPEEDNRRALYRSIGFDGYWY